jgi:tRNA(Arg) A34 adenosine deaminase TadA
MLRFMNITTLRIIRWWEVQMVCLTVPCKMCMQCAVRSRCQALLHLTFRLRAAAMRPGGMVSGLEMQCACTDTMLE